MIAILRRKSHKVISCSVFSLIQNKIRDGEQTCQMNRSNISWVDICLLNIMHDAHLLHIYCMIKHVVFHEDLVERVRYAFLRRTPHRTRRVVAKAT